MKEQVMSHPNQTLGWTWHGSSDPLALSLQTVPLQPLGPKEVLLANKAIALNPVDWKVLDAFAQGWQKGHVPGVDGAGILLAAGADVTLPLGSRVAYHGDLKRNGSFAHHTVVQEKALHLLPESVSFAQAATVPCPGLTSWQAIDKLPLKPGYDVLIIGGGSATGSFLLQFALQRGFRVWTTAAQRHHARLKNLGVSGVFDYHNPQWPHELRIALGKTPLFAAIDTVSEAHARALAPLLGYNGHLVCLQNRFSAPAVPPFTTVLSQHEVALGAIYRFGAERDWQLLRTAAQEIFSSITNGQLQTPAIQPFDFNELPQALVSLKHADNNAKLVAEL